MKNQPNDVNKRRCTKGKIRDYAIPICSSYRHLTRGERYLIIDVRDKHWFQLKNNKGELDYFPSTAFKVLND
jgi:hypothetical protein